MTNKPLIRLYDTCSFGIIILHPSGVLYSNQVGGTACLHPKVEGVYVPIRNELVDQAKLLFEHFTGIKWLGACSNGIDEADADIIDRVLGLSLYTSILRVDRARLKQSCEAWVYVNVSEQSDYPKESHTILGFGDCSGILTWANSD